jgi:hypothetical protein
MCVKEVLVMLAVGSIAYAQGGVCKGKNSVERSINIRVAWRADGKLVEGLEAKDLSVTGKKGSLPVTSARTDLPLDLVVLQQKGLDTTLAGAAARLLTQRLRDGDRVAVLSYGDILLKPKGWMTKPDEIRDALEASAGGGAAIRVRALDAIQEAVRLFPEEKGDMAPKRKRAMLLVGEEWDDASLSRANPVAVGVLSHGAMLYQAVMPFQQRILRAVMPRMTLPNDPMAGPARQAIDGPQQPLRQRVPSVAMITGGEVTGTSDLGYLADMLALAQGQYMVSYCVDRKQANGVPEVAFSDEGKQKFAQAQILGPRLDVK